MKKIYLYSLTSLAVLTSGLAIANQNVYVPELEGGLTGMVGVFLAVPSTSNASTQYLTGVNEPSAGVEALDLKNVEGEYDAGFQASLGYIFEDTGNGIELFYRGYFPDNSSTTSGEADYADEIVPVTATEDMQIDYNDVDLMISQYVNFGQYMQFRLSAGASYVRLDQVQNIYTESEAVGNGFIKEESNFTGWGPRLAADGRYDFGNGIGIAAGASVAFLLGSIDLSTNAVNNGSDDFNIITTDELGSQNVTNLRGNIGLDYVYFFDNDEGSTLGLELGYFVDYYADAVGYFDISGVEQNAENISFVPNTSSVSFSGPYLNLKGVF